MKPIHSFLYNRCGGGMINSQSKAEGAVVYLSARTLLSLFVLPVVLSNFAGRLLRESWVVGPGASSQPGVHNSGVSEGECRVAINSSSSQFLYAYDNTRESCIGYRSPTSRARERIDFDIDKSESKIVFYETLVHPAMFSHENPVRVAVVVGDGGNDEGAVVAEVLKHTTVKHVDVFGGTNCTSDSNSRLIRLCSNPAESLSAVFLRRAAVDQALYDVIVWSNHRSQPSTEIAEVFFKSLSTTGILVVNPPSGKLPRRDFCLERDLLIQDLEQVGFQSIINYEEFWGFLIAMKDRKSKANWFENEAEFQLGVLKRTLPVLINGESPPFRYFDGATMMSLKFPSRLVEDCWRRLHALDDQCGTGHGFDPDVPNVPTSAIEVKTTERAGRGIFTREHISQGSMVDVEQCVQGMYIPPFTYELIEDIFYDEDADWFGLWQGLHAYLHGYGWEDNVYGKTSGGVDPGILTFMNHGCNGTYNIGEALNVTEQDVVEGLGPAANGYDEEYPVYDPVGDRFYPNWGCDDTTRVLKDVEAGEELLDNYLVFGGSQSGEDWEENLAELKRMCSGDGVGSVTQYEGSSRHAQRY